MDYRDIIKSRNWKSAYMNIIQTSRDYGWCLNLNQILQFTMIKIKGENANALFQGKKITDNAA